MLAFRGRVHGSPGLGGKDSLAHPRANGDRPFLGRRRRHRDAAGALESIAQSIAQERRTTLVENARLFAHLNMSVADAGILCWVIKFTFDFFRPITSIREATDERWTPLLNTPPFPAYISGHSTFSSAAAASLAESFGTDKIRFATGCDELPGVTRKFDSLCPPPRKPA